MGLKNERCDTIKGKHPPHGWRVVSGPGVRFEDTGFKQCDGDTDG